MSDSNLPLDLKGLTEPATKLIESIRDAVGILYEPTAIRRKAKAEAEAMVILAKSQAEVRGIEARASERLRSRELRRQENIEKITKQALESMPEEVSKDPVDEDWVYRFFESCQDVSNEDMQSLWGRLLAGEVSRPGSFSLRSLKVVRDLTKFDAQLFTSLCTFVWDVGDIGLMPIMPDLEQEDIRACDLNTPSLLHLESLDLITHDSARFHLSEFSEDAFYYFGRRHGVSTKRGNVLTVGRVIFTSVGKELYVISGATACENYRRATVKAWRENGFMVED